MKYLKIFENFDLGFREISFGSRGPVSKGIGRFQNGEEFTESEANQIEKFLNRYGVSTSVEYQSGFGKNTIGGWMPLKDKETPKKFIRIEKFKDEWFLVTDYPFYYECDQIEGVISFLKTILPEKVEESFKEIDYPFRNISQDEFDRIITSPNIYSFSKSEIKEIRKFIKSLEYKNSALKFNLSTQEAQLFKIDSDFGSLFGMVDEWDLDKSIENDSISIHTDNNIKKYYYQDFSLEDLIKIKNFTIRITLDWNASRVIKEPLDIMKFEDEWFLACHGLDMYKCDQIEGVKKLIENHFSIPIKEAFKDEYDSEFDPNKFSERDKYWDGYLKKMKNDQNELKKEIEEDRHYFTLVDEHELAELFDKIIDFESDEVVEIMDLFTDKYHVTEGRWMHNHEIVNFIKATRPKFCLIKIWKLEDEWYLVSTSDADNNRAIFEKCDQFDGLKRLLNKMLVK